MRIKALEFGLALAIAAAVFWVVCAAVVSAIPGPMMTMTGHMMHADFSGMNWNLSIGGLVGGLFAWAVFAGVFGWLSAIVYNYLAKRNPE